METISTEWAKRIPM